MSPKQLFRRQEKRRSDRWSPNALKQCMRSESISFSHSGYSSMQHVGVYSISAIIERFARVAYYPRVTYFLRRLRCCRWLKNRNSYCPKLVAVLVLRKSSSSNHVALWYLDQWDHGTLLYRWLKSIVKKIEAIANCTQFHT